MIDLTLKARRLFLCTAPLLLIWGAAAGPACAQDATALAQVQNPSANDQAMSKAQVEQLVAPIALYPDSLLMQVLMASTYPLEVVEAARWSHDNPTLQGPALQSAMQSQPWDPSVKALAAVPQTLDMMSDKLDWTEQLGNAFLAQQQGVLDAVQRLRAEAQAAGNLQSTPQQVVTTAPAPAGVAGSGAPRPIVIEPVNPDVYYVPVYNPAVVYGAWDYPAYPPFYWSPPGFVGSNIVSFAAGVAVGAAIWGECNWWNHNVFINVNRYNVFNRTDININVWVHDPAHRGPVPYRNAAVAARFGRSDDMASRQAFRDRVDARHDDPFRERGDIRPGDANESRLIDPRPEAARRLDEDTGRATPRDGRWMDRSNEMPRADRDAPRAYRDVPRDAPRMERPEDFRRDAESFRSERREGGEFHEPSFRRR